MAELLFSVSQINEYISRKVLSDPILKKLSVKGEITNLNVNSSGIAYFALKDDTGIINCISFDFYEKTSDLALRDGTSVIAGASLSYYQKTGKLQLNVVSFTLCGAGELYLKFEHTKKKLFEQGIFDDAAKKPLPKYPTRIGVVTSPTGAVIQDIINVISRRSPYLDLTLYPCRVQGDGAAEEIAAGIEYFNEAGNVDLIIIARGGGSFEDLFAFNEEAVAMAVYESELPVISAVGHETDYTICDMAADLRAPTPSAAAELCAPALSELSGELYSKREALKYLMARYLSEWESAVSGLKARLHMVSPNAAVLGALKELQLRALRLNEAYAGWLEKMRLSLEGKAAALDALNPHHVIERGYFYIQKNGRMIKSVSSLHINDNVAIIGADGCASAAITDIEEA